jgi:tetratricopeptide (TPR) repeat protein
LQLDPQLPEARNNLGNALLELGQYEDAAGSYRLALRVKPDDVRILCNLGNAERLLGQFDQAIASTRRAIALNPAAALAHNSLGRILAAVGQREQAAASYRQALLLDPGYVEALNNLGNVLREIGQRREAAALYRKAVELDPGHAESHCNLGTVLFEFRRVDEAVASYRQALALRPDYAAAHLALGLALRQQRRPADAEASARAALAVDPSYVEALSLLGELRADSGQFAEAEKFFQRAIGVDPDFSFAYCSIATHRKMTGGDTAWLKGAENLLAKPLPLGHQISLQYALGKYFDDVRHYDRAFGHYRQANELTKRYGSVYDPGQLSRLADELIGRFDASFMQSCQAQASSSELPVFVIGMPRSGTSLAEQILASHPAVFGAGEVAFWNAAYHARQSAQPGSAIDAATIPGMASDYLEHLSSLAGGAQRVVDKLPANFLYAGLIHGAFPQARIIHMQRHPIDTCLSIYFQNFFSIGPYANDLGDLAHYYRQYLRITDHWRAVLPATTLLEIPYEGLIEDQEGWTRRMLEFIGLPWDPRCLDFHQTERVVITASKWQVRQKISNASIARWRHYEPFVGPLRDLLDSSRYS